MPWSLEKGNEGSANYIEIIKKDGQTEKVSNVNGLILNVDDVIRIHTANGAGYGDPKKRDRKSIEADIKNEYITPEQAKKYYNFEIFRYLEAGKKSNPKYNLIFGRRRCPNTPCIIIFNQHSIC